MSADPNGPGHERESPVGLGTLLTPVLIPPAAWFVHLTGSSVLVPWACDRDATWMLHGVTLLALLATGAATAIALRSRRRLGHASVVTAPGQWSDSEGAPGWARFLAAAGVGFGVGFFLLVVLAGIPALVLDPCVP